jgi:hypothetical protein
MSYHYNPFLGEYPSSETRRKEGSRTNIQSFAAYPWGTESNIFFCGNIYNLGIITDFMEQLSLVYKIRFYWFLFPPFTAAWTFFLLLLPSWSLSRKMNLCKNFEAGGKRPVFANSSVGSKIHDGLINGSDNNMKVYLIGCHLPGMANS